MEFLHHKDNIFVKTSPNSKSSQIPVPSFRHKKIRHVDPYLYLRYSNWAQDWPKLSANYCLHINSLELLIWESLSMLFRLVDWFNSIMLCLPNPWLLITFDLLIAVLRLFSLLPEWLITTMMRWCKKTSLIISTDLIVRLN